MPALRAFAAVTLLTITFAACGGDDDDPTTTALPATPPPATATATTGPAAATATAGSSATSQPAATPTESPPPTATATRTPAPPPSPTRLPTATPDPVVYSDIIFGDLVEDRGGEYPEGVPGIFAVDADGSDLHALTNPPEGSGDSWPSVSPDGKRVAFIRFGGDGGGVYVVDIETGEERWIADGRAWMHWSPDGSRLLLEWQEHSFGLACCGGGRERDDPIRIATVNPDGSDLQVLVEPTYVEGSGGTLLDSAAWSPDGTRIAFTQTDIPADDSWFTRSIAVIYADGSGIRLIDMAGITVWDGPAWLADSETLIFLGRDTRFLNGALYSVRTDGSRLNRLTSPDISVGGFRVAPDGSTIVFDGYVVNPPPKDGIARSSLYAIASDGGRLTLLTPPELTVNLDYAFSPDSRRVVLEVWDEEAETTSVLIVDTDGADAALFAAPNKCWLGWAWSPDSAKIAYISCGDGYSNDLRVITVSNTTVSEPVAQIRSERRRGRDTDLAAGRG
ncbi:MAG: hypothetical protein DCC58_12195 [Chloroflexi bacterium]|nr:MAG: hypothetical protein DCC58_12195 [Chloroflexota bacterium]